MRVPWRISGIGTDGSPVAAVKEVSDSLIDTRFLREPIYLVDAELAALSEQGATRLLLDLRMCPGGLLEASLHDIHKRVWGGVGHDDRVDRNPIAPVGRDHRSFGTTLVIEPEELGHVVGRTRRAPPPLKIRRFVESDYGMRTADSMQQGRRRLQVLNTSPMFFAQCSHFPNLQQGHRPEAVNIRPSAAGGSDHSLGVRLLPLSGMAGTRSPVMPTCHSGQPYQRQKATVRRSRVTRWTSSGWVFTTRSALTSASWARRSEDSLTLPR